MGRDIVTVLRLAAQYLADKGIESSRLDAEVLMAHVLGVSRIRLYVEHDRPLTPEELKSYRDVIARRAQRIPVAYIIGHKEFMSLDFLVDASTLIPRPDTEVLVECATEALKSMVTDELRILDIGTGSGVIACSLAKLFPGSRVTAVDICQEALAIAKMNAHRLGLLDRIHLVVGDLFQGVEGQFHAIISNPPYVPDRELLSLPPEIAKYEPRLALAAGEDGLAVIRKIVAAAPKYMEPRGVLAIEIGRDQGDRVAELLDSSGYSQVRRVRDYSGNERVVMGWVDAGGQNGEEH